MIVFILFKCKSRLLPRCSAGVRAKVSSLELSTDLREVPQFRGEGPCPVNKEKKMVGGHLRACAFCEGSLTALFLTGVRTLHTSPSACILSVTFNPFM